MKAMEREKEEMESEKSDLENQFEALKLMVEPYRYFSKSKLTLSYFIDLGPVFHLFSSSFSFLSSAVGRLLHSRLIYPPH